MISMSILQEAKQDFLDSGYPTVSYAIARVEDALKEIRMVANARPVEEWEARIKTVAAVALPLQTDREAVRALNFKATSSLPLYGLIKDLKEAITYYPHPSDDVQKEIISEIDSEKEAVPGLERILVMRQNIAVAMSLQTNDEIKRWLAASIAPVPRVVKTWDKRVLFDPDAQPEEAEA